MSHVPSQHLGLWVKELQVWGSILHPKKKAAATGMNAAVTTIQNLRVQSGGSENSIAAANSLLDGTRAQEKKSCLMLRTPAGRFCFVAVGAHKLQQGGARYIQANQLVLISRLTLFTLTLNSPVSTWTGLMFSHKKKKKRTWRRTECARLRACLIFKWFNDRLSISAQPSFLGVGGAVPPVKRHRSGWEI